MDPLYLLYFLGFGLVFGIAGTLIVYAAGYLPVDRRVAGLVVLFCGFAARFYYRLQMPPTPGVPIPLLTTVSGFLIHPLFIAAGVLIFSGLGRYHTCIRKGIVFSALFFTAGITAVLGAMGFYTLLQPGTGWSGASDFTIIPGLFTGLFDTCLAAIIFMSACEVYFLMQKKGSRSVPER